MEMRTELASGVGWSAPAGLRDHGGREIPVDAEFFAPPPPEIGDITSADTTLRSGLRPRGQGVKLGLATAAMAACVAAGYFVVSLNEAPPYGLWALFWLPVSVVLGVVVWFRLGAFQHGCTYVGTKGMARYLMKGDRQDIRTDRVFRWDEAKNLYKMLVDHRLNGSYSSTEVVFRWEDAGGKPVMIVQYRFREPRGGRSNPGSKLHDFFAAGEAAWTLHLFDQSMARDGEEGGGRPFETPTGEWVRVASDSVEFHLGATSGRATERWPRGSLMDSQMRAGVLLLRFQDGARSKVVELPSQWIPNFELFKMLLLMAMV